MKAFDVAERDLGIARLLDVEGEALYATMFMSGEEKHDYSRWLMVKLY